MVPLAGIPLARTLASSAPWKVKMQVCSFQAKGSSPVTITMTRTWRKSRGHKTQLPKRVEPTQP
eukprot:3714726-Amphidinium_carterae.1